MRGGKREGAGRPGLGPSKSYWLPIAIEKEVLELLENYRNKTAGKPAEKPAIESHRKSKEPVKPPFPILSKPQLDRFKNLLIETKFAKSKSKAIDMTRSWRLCQDTFLEIIHQLDETHYNSIADIADLYIVEDFR